MNSNKKNIGSNIENGNNIPNRVDNIPSMFNENSNLHNLQSNLNQNASMFNNQTDYQNIQNPCLNSIANINNTEDDSIKDDLNSSLSSNDRKNKKPFMERVGDWVCIKCKNLNFSFRVMCNRCQMTKYESEKLTDQYLINYSNFIKFNEMIQQRILMNHPINMPNNQRFLLNNINPNFAAENNFINNSAFPQEFMDNNLNLPWMDNNMDNFKNINYPSYNNHEENFRNQEDFKNQGSYMGNSMKIKVNGQINNNNNDEFPNENIQK
jgi:hypothetical protein